jgi:hypothetical protein
MKYFFPMLCVAAAGGAGYLFEPKITPNLISYNQTKARYVDGGVAEKSKPEPALPTPEKEATPEPVKPEPVEPPVVKNDPAPPPVPEPTPEPPVADNGGEKMKDDPTPPPLADPAPAVGSAGSLSADDIVKLMQESIKSQQVKEFTFEQVLAWKGGEEEEVDGAKYQTGVAAYKAETIFGVKTIQAKALIQSGKVTKWIWPNSGMEIK